MLTRAFRHTLAETALKQRFDLFRRVGASRQLGLRVKREVTAARPERASAAGAMAPRTEKNKSLKRGEYAHPKTKTNLRVCG